jgi:hypothetical protein
MYNNSNDDMDFATSLPEEMYAEDTSSTVDGYPIDYSYRLASNNSSSDFDQVDTINCQRMLECGFESNEQLKNRVSLQQTHTRTYSLCQEESFIMNFWQNGQTAILPSPNPMLIYA